MNDRAFTLVELLGIIIILSVILTLVFPSVTGIINQSKETTYQTQINKVLNAAYDYTLKNPKFLPESGEISFITLGELKQEGLIESDFTNPENLEAFPNDLIVIIRNTNETEYDKKISKKEGKYLYTVKEGSIDNDGIAPTIVLPINIASLELNDPVPDISYIPYSASDSAGNDITSKVKYFIAKGDSIVNSIDTSAFAVYKLYFVVVDSAGNSTSKILNVIVGDTTNPTLSIPSNKTISVGSGPLNLRNGASCEDNSGFCDITVTESIDYQTSGVYTVTYTAQDPSGNTATKERIITIE